MADINIYIVTFNCGRSYIDTEAFASQLFSNLTSSELPDLVVLSLQEIAPIPHSLIGGSFLVPYFIRFNHAVQKGARKWSDATDDLPLYDPIAARNLGMTGIMVFAKKQTWTEDIEYAGVGVGLAEMGNKGAAAIRLKYRRVSTSVELTFVAAHLAAMEWEVKRRNEDWKNIVRGLVFSSTTKRRSATSLAAENRPLLSISPRDASIYKPTSYLFVAGDLNYRTSSMSPSRSDHKETFPQPHEDDSSPRHYSSLFEHDQLTQERSANRTLHGLDEAAVTFPPTYKYTSKGPFLTPDDQLKEWNWAKHRWPSWCDRILFLDAPIWLCSTVPTDVIVHKYSVLPLLPTSDHRPVTLEVTVPFCEIPAPGEDEDADDPRIHPPFEIDIDWKSKRERARKLELIAGFAMYFTTTLEGGGVMLAMAVGAIGAYFAFRAMLEM
ncbi:inositol 5-phosphatase-like protein [Mollisia scopiformis]|uniref:Inositol 5-phosphatase-like protein n=1 Tax=Mollisia scopiformis TaxID=149040 RepID=A0A132B1Q9_MOLSC|nr:inositol 5-phosphatase-like protein [Mollisia scopiformis]KUJ06315.1 inositol 5-phosphatase-like protein [Mollisia scopiformis]